MSHYEGSGAGADAPERDDSAEYLDDLTFIRDMRHESDGPWHFYDVLLDVRGYGWETMLDWADYMAGADLEDISQVLSFSAAAEDIDATASFLGHGGKIFETPELENENGGLSIGGISKTLGAPMKIVWYNQTNVMRFITFEGDELLIRKYVETVIRRTFGEEDAMKLGKPLND